MTIAPGSIRTNNLGFRSAVSAPGFVVPEGACDAHMHIIGPLQQFPLRETRSLSPLESLPQAYRKTQAALGLQRTIVVQPSSYAKDNSCTLAAVEALGPGARAVAVVDPSTPDDELASLHRRGVRGVRLQSVVAGGASLDDLEELAARIKPFGWHLQLFLDAETVPQLSQRLRKLPVDVVFDHMAHVDTSVGIDTPGFRAVLDLLETGRVWVKIASAFRAADGRRASALIDANPDRLVWGSDWPHLGYQAEPPDDGQLLNDLAEWCGNAETLKKILVDNPGKLYFSQQPGA